ncbi:MAG: type IV secretory system conjugative DNA transfer family protein [Oscillospiraceae bacterium]|nr:type IV secretory system conjugative DNA transfer family protein [Oscillospiraceae bacterium]
MKMKFNPKAIAPSVIFFFGFFIGNRLSHSYNMLPVDTNPFTKFPDTLNQFGELLRTKPIYIDLRYNSLGLGLVLGAIALGIFYAGNVGRIKSPMEGKEYGSARWGTPKDISPFIDELFDNNLILTDSEFLTMKGRMANQEHNRNKNVIVVGSSGSGKTRFFIKPNLMQCGPNSHTSFIVTDPKGSIIHECGSMLQEEGYIIKSVNLIEYDRSDYYNPFAYIRNEIDILSLIDNLLSNTDGGEGQIAQDFWVKSERALLCALIGFVHYHFEKKDRHFGSVLNLLALAHIKENDEDFVSPLDDLFDSLKNDENSNPFLTEQYTIFKTGAGVTIKSIIISVGVRLAPFTMPTIKALTSQDTLNLERIGDEKTALFIVIPDTNKTLNFLVAIMYQQLFDTLCRHADTDCGGSLDYHVRFLLDEFANIGTIPNFEIYMATVRSRNLSFNISLQTLAQLKSIYDTKTEIITGNADSLLFLGGMEESTLKFFSETIGKTTINVESRGYSFGSAGGSNKGFQKIGRELMTPDEIGKMSRSDCLLVISNLPPFLSKKYDITRHPRYSMLSDYDPDKHYVYRKNDINSHLKYLPVD